MNLRDYDLNLLTIFDAVMRKGSVSGAAEQLEMTSAAVSQAISRLRERSADPLFVRHGRGIRPTNHALTMHQHIKKGLRSIERGLDSGQAFNPADSTRNFVIAGESYLDSMLFPALLIHTRQKAPSVTIELVSAEDSINKVSSLLSERKADLFLSTETIELSSIEQEWLKNFEMVVVCSGTHPRIQNTLSVQQFFEEEHVTLKTKRLNERFLSRLTSQPLPPRKIAYESHSALNMVVAAASTELLSLSHRWLALQWQEKLNMQILDVPFDIMPAPVYMSWHQSKRDDPGLVWLRQQLEEIMKDIHKLPDCGHD